ncbi:unnamed protein product [Symbiodinium necroappetens]|uniref:Major facilitator superfamily (MFS) profile domain-containing protein n=1 Tax=Symbiodinium necroappetens TaxID=1628268 RepID=A0A812JNF9_9DINO|nr:unnamed protein product [Symbiodinium necroappetens]
MWPTCVRNGRPLPPAPAGAASRPRDSAECRHRAWSGRELARAALMGGAAMASWRGRKNVRPPPFQACAAQSQQRRLSGEVRVQALLAIYYLYCMSFLGFTCGLPLGPALTERGLDVGAFTSCFFVGQLLGNITLPILSERAGTAHVLVGSLAISAAAWFYLGFALLQNVPLQWIFLARGVAGFGSGIVPVLRSFLVQSLPEKDQLSASLAYGEAAGQIAFTLGPFLGGAVADLFGLSIPFCFIAFLCLCGALICISVLPRRESHERDATTLQEEGPGEDRAQTEAGEGSLCWSAWRSLGVSLVLSSVRFLLNPFIPFLLLRQYHFSTSMLGSTLSLLSVFIFLCQIGLVQPLKRWMGVKQTCALGILSKAAALAVLGAFPALLAPALALYAFGLALAFAALPGVVVSTAPESRRSRFLVLEASISSFARIASPLAIGLLRSPGSFNALSAMLLGSAALLL